MDSSELEQRATKQFGKALLLSVSGIDGSGKTTHGKQLVKYLTGLGTSCRYQWMGWRPIFSYPILTIARTLGHTRRMKLGNNTFFKREPESNKVIGLLWPYMVLADYFVAILHVRISLFLDKVVVCDRYVYDLMAELLDHELYTRRFSTLATRMFPTPDLSFLLDVPENVSWKRLFEEERKREQPYYDLCSRRKTYSALAKHFDLIVIDGSADFARNQERIRREVSEKLKILLLEDVEKRISKRLREKHRARKGSPGKKIFRFFNNTLYRLSRRSLTCRERNTVSEIPRVGAFGGNILDGVLSYIGSLRKKGITIHTAVILGSRAKDRWKPESDVDLLVISGKVLRGIVKRLVLLDRTSFVGIEPDSRTQEEFLHMVEQLNLKALEAMYFGKVVYDDGFWQKAKERFNEVEQEYQLGRIGIKKALLEI